METHTKIFKELQGMIGWASILTTSPAPDTSSAPYGRLICLGGGQGAHLGGTDSITPSTGKTVPHQDDDILLQDY